MSCVQKHATYTLPIIPQPLAKGLTARVSGLDQDQKIIVLNVIEEQAWTLYLDAVEIVTVMTIGDYPDLLGLGYLINQNLITSYTDVTAIDIDQELRIVVVRTHTPEDTPTLSRRIRTSGCAEGTMFEHVLANLADKHLALDGRLDTHTMGRMLSVINTTPSLYLDAGAIHGCVLCRHGQVLAYMEDVGRHNAVDKIAGLMATQNLASMQCWFYTTGRLTTEMVLKTVQMGIPILVSRSGFTAAGVALAQQAGLTLIGRARGKRFQILSHPERIEFSATSQTTTT
ncbi:MAG: formate dehydrogenase accessory sulfurtransferase FdhD [Alphaproteobacteria bacterium]|nr:formate dehydrogenase accessory sulfurtransferase FdhD [Alphaproteobacteria bacterium]